MAQPITFEDPPIDNRPKPTDFVNFIPWACRALSIEIDVVVTTAAQEMYAETVSRVKKPISKRHQSKIKQLSEAPVVDVSSDEDKPSSVQVKLPIVVTIENKVVIDTVYDLDGKLVQLKFLKNKTIPRLVMKVIALAIPYHPYLTSIIINKGLRVEALYEISMFLPNSRITEICLDDTYLIEANYHILLTGGYLKFLSLARCTINDAVVKLIAEQLKDPCPASKVLSALNLSSNRITDVGAKYLADMLRSNRQLSYLNLAGNMINDEGGIRILDTLYEFPLLNEELKESRARFVAYLKQKNYLISTYMLELQTSKQEKSPKRKITKKIKNDSISLHMVKSLMAETIDGQCQEKAEFMAERTLGLFNEPFSPNNTRTQDGVVYCCGNNTLCYLNLAFNNLSYPSLKKLHEVVSAQACLKKTPSGLIKVVIEGNLLPDACKEYGEIDRLLGGFRKQSVAPPKKKVASSRSNK